MQGSVLMIFRDSSAARRLTVVALGWVASVPVLLALAWTLWAASQAGLDADAGPAPLVAATLFALHMLATLVQSVAFARAAASRPATWRACLCVTALFGIAALLDTGIFDPRLELLGLFGLPHVMFVVLLLAVNRPDRTRALERTLDAAAPAER